MTEQEALVYLNTTKDNWQEAIESLVFELKKDIFRRALVAPLLLKKAEKVKQWAEAKKALESKKIERNLQKTIKLPPLSDAKKETLISLYRSYEKELMQIKLELSKTLDPIEVAFFIQKMGELELERQKIILPLAQKIIQEPYWEVKISEVVETGIILSELKQFEKEDVTSKKDLFLLPNFERDLHIILKSNQ